MATHTLFPGQRDQEKIYLVIHEHWFYLLSRLLLWVIFAVLLFLIEKYVPVYLPIITQAPYLPYYQLFTNLYTIFMTLGVFMIWAIYYLNIQIITDQRIVDVSQQSLFMHRVSELDLNKIEDVTGETTGFFGTMLSFGNVYIQTAGTVERFTFGNVPHPDKIEKLILDLYQQKQQHIPSAE